MSEAFVNIDLHGMTREEAMKVIESSLRKAGPFVYQIRVVHGFHRGTSLRSMIYEEFRYDQRIRRIIPGDNPGITVLILKELY